MRFKIASSLHDQGGWVIGLAFLRGFRQSWRRAATIVGVLGIVTWTAVVQIPAAHAEVNCAAIPYNLTRSGGTAYGRGYAYCSPTAVYQVHVYVRIFRTDVSPAKTIASNSRTCEIARRCPGSGYVVASGQLTSGCHYYQVRAGGWFIPLGMPVQLPMATGYGQTQYWCRT